MLQQPLLPLYLILKFGSRKESNLIMEKSSNSKLEFTVTKQKPTLVQPSEETQKGLYFLSNLDNAVPLVNRVILCFRSLEKGNEMAPGVIKNALSKLLVQYYPVAGRLKIGEEGKFVVDCNEEGALFVEAEANCTIEELGDMTRPETVTLRNLVYDIDTNNTIIDSPPLVAQVTRFQCGGYIVGLRTSHLVFDGFGATRFFNSWGETARGLPLTYPPSLDRSVLRARDPPKVEFPLHAFQLTEDISNIRQLLITEEIQYRCFSLDPDQLRRLKTIATEDGLIAKCSTFEVVSAFIWRSRTRAFRMQPNQVTKLITLVDFRSRLNPPLALGYMGNAYVWTHAMCSASELLGKPLSFAVQMIHKAVEMVTDAYVRSVIDHYEITRSTQPPRTDVTSISCWTHLPFQTVDFGWGGPFFWGPVSMHGSESIRLTLHGKDRKSINVAVGLPISAMEIFQELMHV